jgi:hypothetical protein
MDAITRNHSVSKPARRQALIAAFAPLQVFKIHLTSLLVCLILTIQILSFLIGFTRSPWLFTPSIQSARLAEFSV